MELATASYLELMPMLVPYSGPSSERKEPGPAVGFVSTLPVSQAVS